MARKAVLTGGKRDEIIDIAMKLFFENGYEATSVRMIMNTVGGEIGMFYHYFKSKDELFDKVVERFFEGYSGRFEKMIGDCETAKEIVDNFLPLYSQSMSQFAELKGNMHWSIQYAMHARTVAALVPAVASFLQKTGKSYDTPVDILAAQLVCGISATIHSPSFEKIKAGEKKNCLMSYIDKILHTECEKKRCAP